MDIVVVDQLPSYFRWKIVSETDAVMALSSDCPVVKYGHLFCMAW